MMRGKSFWQLYGGYLVMMVIAAMLIVWGRSYRANQLEANANTEATANTAAATTSPDTSSENSSAAAALIPSANVTTYNMAELPIVYDYSLAPNYNPRTFQGKLPTHQLITYTVEMNDTPGIIAQQFGIKTETILGCNPELSKDSGQLGVGVVLIICPQDGVLHDVLPGETLESLSIKYSIPVEEIIAYMPNNLEFPFRLYPGTQIFIPGAVREVFVWNPPSLPSGPSGQSLVVGTGTFIWPVSSRNLSQGYWYGHQAIDVALSEGSAAYASDTGTVTYASWNIYCYGNLIVINHGNGYETFYAHLSGFNVVPGQIVYQGDLIGYTGNTGCSSGPHIHFEIRLNGARQSPLWTGYLP
ncbi:MAG: peptidoglycan DD-metalloendopeptidase family protein [Chloroflexi bacterium]|nr:peptidoglycan DD-metalloendopeptidase family protein [Chloroflexota bacterium]MBP8058850.1 peptidoglycan DD-metalloendopeptidase family protein [Chloroflexota bacterium]